VQRAEDQRGSQQTQAGLYRAAKQHLLRHGGQHAQQQHVVEVQLAQIDGLLDEMHDLARSLEPPACNPDGPGEGCADGQAGQDLGQIGQA